jgi:hypothetical protein
MKPFIMRPPLKFQDDRHFDHGSQEIIFVLSGQMEIGLGGNQLRPRKKSRSPIGVDTRPFFRLRRLRLAFGQNFGGSFA